MALSADQTAMLELLLDGGQSYDNLADLFGLDVSEVRLRARTALAAIGGSDPDRKVPLSDYLLGQADPIDRADAVRHLKEDEDDHALAQRILDGLAEIAPNAALVKLPAEPGGGRFLRKPPPTAPSPGSAAPAGSSPASRPNLSPRQTRLIAILGGGAVILIAIVLAVTGAFSGDDGSQASDTITDASNTGTDASGNDTATIALKAPGDGKAKGTAIVGVASGDQAYVDVSISGLDPSPKGKTYVIWMLLTKNQGYPLAPIQTDKDGNYENRFPIDSAVLSVVARVQNINVSVAPVPELRTALKGAVKKSSIVIDRVGDTVLDGPIPKSEQTTVPQTSTPDAGTTPPQTSTPDAGTTTTP